MNNPIVSRMSAIPFLMMNYSADMEKHLHSCEVSGLKNEVQFVLSFKTETYFCMAVLTYTRQLAIFRVPLKSILNILYSVYSCTDIYVCTF